MWCIFMGTCAISVSVNVIHCFQEAIVGGRGACVLLYTSCTFVFTVRGLGLRDITSEVTVFSVGHFGIVVKVCKIHSALVVLTVNRTVCCQYVDLKFLFLP